MKPNEIGPPEGVSLEQLWAAEHHANVSHRNDLQEVADSVEVLALAVQDAPSGAAEIERAAGQPEGAFLNELAQLHVYCQEKAEPLRWAALDAKKKTNGWGTGDNDLWIASTALARGWPLVTCDLDFCPVEGLDLIYLPAKPDSPSSCP
jgi:hypothetical protein